MNTFCLRKQRSFLKSSVSRWSLIALLAIWIPNDGIHAHDEGSGSSSDMYDPVGPTPGIGNKDISSDSSNESLYDEVYANTPGIDNEDIDTLRDRIKQIDFKSFKTPEGNAMNRHWQKRAYRNLNEALKKIKVKTPIDDKSQKFVGNKEEISVYQLLKMLLHENPKSNSNPHNNDKNIKEEEFTPPKTPLQQCPEPLLRALDSAIKNYCENIKSIKKKEIHTILGQVMKDDYYCVYVRKVIRKQYPNGHNRGSGLNLKYVMRSCDEEAGAFELYEEIFHDSATGAESDTGTVIIDGENYFNLVSKQNYGTPLIIVVSSIAGLGYHFNKKSKNKTKKAQEEDDADYIEEEDDTEQVNTAEIGETYS